MREIKFRAWFEVEKKMVESENLGFQYEGDEENPFTFAFDKTDIDESGNEKGTLCFALMQYTGLKDKNGREIYEGDIIRIYNDEIDEEDSWIGEVSYHIGGFFSGDEDLLGNVHFRAKVIGNIYENPELLEDK